MAQYKKKEGMSGSYIVFEIDNESENSIEIKMLGNNNIPGVFKCDLRYEDNMLYLYYDIKEKTSLAESIKTQKIKYEILAGIYAAIVETVNNCEKYLISADSILLMPELIFCSRRCDKFEFCIFPSENNSFRTQIKNLTEELMKTADHSDDKTVNFIYGIYDIVSSDTYYIGDIKEFLNNYYISQIKGNEENFTEYACEENLYDDKKEIKYSDRTLTERNKLRNKDREARKHGANNIDEGQDIRKNVFGKEEFKGENNSECFSLVRGKIKNAFIRQFIPEIVKVKKSDSFGCGMEWVIHVGRERKNELVLPQNYISRKHAILEADENFLYVTDKGSLNGTYVNGEKIAANVRTRCEVQDEITFADISFTVAIT